VSEDKFNEPLARISKVSTGSPITAAGWNAMVDAINRTKGVRPPQQARRPARAPAETILCRLVVTTADTDDNDDPIELRDYPTVDGQDVVVGDMILVSRDDDEDGVYEVGEEGGFWRRVWKLTPEQGTDPAAIMEQGQLVSVYDGASFPVLYMAGIEAIEEV